MSITTIFTPAIAAKFETVLTKGTYLALATKGDITTFAHLNTEGLTGEEHTVNLNLSKITDGEITAPTAPPYIIVMGEVCSISGDVEMVAPHLSVYQALSLDAIAKLNATSTKASKAAGKGAKAATPSYDLFQG